MAKTYYVYITTDSSHHTLYTGMTSDLSQRVWQHKNGQGGGFTSRYKSKYLVYYAETNDVYSAIAEEKRIKGGSRAQKIALIEQQNPEWKDLSADWYER